MVLMGLLNAGKILKAGIGWIYQTKSASDCI